MSPLPTAGSRALTSPWLAIKLSISVGRLTIIRAMIWKTNKAQRLTIISLGNTAIAGLSRSEISEVDSVADQDCCASAPVTKSCAEVVLVAADFE